MQQENPTVQTGNESIIQKILIAGDLSRMSDPEKAQYYNSICESLGLNPLTNPFAIIRFQGKERLYALKDCTEQLRKIHGVSITELTTTELRGVFVVTAKAQDKTGKTDAATGAVPIENLKGDNLANALMKAETKAKRRVTLSICGLGMLDESEIETMPGAQTLPTPQTNISLPPVEAKVGKEFKVKYQTPEQVTEVLVKANNLVEIAALYYVNAELAEQFAALKSAFTDAKNKLKGTQSIVSFEDLAELFELKKAELSEDERKSSERILQNKETTSYNKLHKELSSK